MPTTTTCSSCGRPLRVPDNLIGKSVKCPACGQVFTAEADWHSLERKLVKSCRPTRACAATCIFSWSSATGTCQTRPRSRAGGLRRARMR